MAINNSQIEGLVRSLGAIIGTYVVAKGWIPVGVWNDLLGAMVLLATAGWSWKSNSTPALITAVAAAPEVEKVVVTSDLHKTLVKNTKIEAVPPATIWMG